MERLTKRELNNGGLIQLHRCDKTDCNYCTLQCKPIDEVLKKLKEYEDLEEKGMLVKLPAEAVFFIVDRKTKWATVMRRDIKNLTVTEIKNIDKDGRYFSTWEKAQKAIVEDLRNN